jgi:hypothetical protein
MNSGAETASTVHNPTLVGAAYRLGAASGHLIGNSPKVTGEQQFTGTHSAQKTDSLSETYLAPSKISEKAKGYRNCEAVTCVSSIPVQRDVHDG